MTSQVFHDSKYGRFIPEPCAQGPKIIRSETYYATKLLKNNKSSQTDDKYPSIRCTAEPHLQSGSHVKAWLESIFG